MPDQIDGHRIVRLLGEGGFGAVYLAQDRNTNELIAVKTLLQERRAIAEEEAHFQREYNILERLNHPGVVQPYRVGSDPGHGLYFTMPYLDGGTLEQARQSGTTAIGVLLNWWIDLVHILAHAHDHGLVHRDLKPQNVLIDQERIIVVDWGLGRIGGTRPHVTGPCGTQDWSPQELGEGEAGTFTDTFGLMGLLGWIITGLPPWELTGNEATQLAEAGYHNPELAAVLQRGLSRFPDRYQTIRELAQQVSKPLVSLKRQIIEQSITTGTDASVLFWPRLMQANTNSLQPKCLNIDFYRDFPHGARTLSYLRLGPASQILVDRYLQLGVRLAKEEGVPDSDRQLWRIQTEKDSVKEHQWIFGQRSADSYRVTRLVKDLSPQDQSVVFDFLFLAESMALEIS